MPGRDRYLCRTCGQELPPTELKWLNWETGETMWCEYTDTPHQIDLLPNGLRDATWMVVDHR